MSDYVRFIGVCKSSACLPCLLPCSRPRLMTPPVSFDLPIAITLVGYASSVLGLAVCKALGVYGGGGSGRSSGGSGGGGDVGSSGELKGGGGGGAAIAHGGGGFGASPRHAHRSGGSGSSGGGDGGLLGWAWAWGGAQPWFLIVTTAGAPLLANYSLLLNSVGVYQLSKVRRGIPAVGVCVAVACWLIGDQVRRGRPGRL